MYNKLVATAVETIEYSINKLKKPTYQNTDGVYAFQIKDEYFELEVHLEDGYGLCSLSITHPDQIKRRRFISVPYPGKICEDEHHYNKGVNRTMARTYNYIISIVESLVVGDVYYASPSNIFDVSAIAVSDTHYEVGIYKKSFTKTMSMDKSEFHKKYPVTAQIKWSSR